MCNPIPIVRSGWILRHALSVNLYPSARYSSMIKFITSNLSRFTFVNLQPMNFSFSFYCVLNREWILIWWIICLPQKENIKFCRVLSRFAFQKKHSRESRYVFFFCRVLFRFCLVMVVRKCIFIYCIKC